MPLRPRVVEDVTRADPTVAKRLGELGVATVHEAAGRTGLMHGIGAVTPGLAMGGTAVTCLNYAGDNLMVHAALALCEPGDVLVVGVLSPSSHGMFGELLATSARARGVRGVVLDAGVRDVAALRAMGFPAWAKTIGAAGTEKALPGWVNVPVSCGGTVVFPGDVVVGDDDGVVVVGREDAAEVLERAEARVAREEGTRARLQAGELGLDIYGLRERLPQGNVGGVG
ncbi:4-carboxy-4-hydroxy-2-oxoadipate aldolase/oxaloacetate decarboxylase [Aciditerrimonas ferrireducens]|uniref:Putative 4-hydroxy-4-methyl-2-oxoglutarate aldolase n=1 Tax=Aciditerrimonas ferrireducens TaxID=667306 RepID=A0ABV6C0E5_9ACTN|nr:4-carboxy-4-hydroxy-2-oxoadipate aldolase/oxaloacetate decarboxylase [Aciditerrimonas ferrireducens]MCK4176239.1 4-carboxy-4-hydroxy-2-oxoadipate aldolase/oxaloacetate decarboxylase [Aciditerrimonas ferrireducens]